MSTFDNANTTTTTGLANTNTNLNTKLGGTTTGAFAHKTALGAQPGFAKEEAKLVLSDEELVVGKRKVNAGSVEVEKRVDTQTVSVPISLKHEEAQIERRPIKHDAAIRQGASTSATATATTDSSRSTTHAFQPETIKVATTAEQAIATKAVVPKEEIRLTKTNVSETKPIHETLRKEHADVHNNLQALPNIHTKQGQTGVHGAPLPQFDSNGGRVVAFEEKLGVGKQVVPTGEVSVTKRVETQPVQASVGLTHEELKVDRLPITGGASAFDTSSAFHGGGATRINLTAEEAVIGKRVVPKEEVILKKKEEVAQKAVQTQLRSESVKVAPTTTTTTTTSTTGPVGTGYQLNAAPLSSSSASFSSSSASSFSSSSMPSTYSTTTGAGNAGLLHAKKL